MGLARIEIIALFPPSFGMVMESQGNRVVVSRTIHDSAASKAGVRKGEILAAVNGKVMKDLKNAMKLLGQYSIGETAKKASDLS